MKKKKHHLRIFICYKNFSKVCNVSHLGVGVTAQYTAKTLTHAGYRAEAIPIYGGDDLDLLLAHAVATKHPVTHVVVSALFIDSMYLAKLARKYPTTKFAVNCHSNVGFLQAEPAAIEKVRQTIDLEIGTTNVFASGNNRFFAKAMTVSYGHPVMFLPNLYFLHGKEPIHRPIWQGGLLKVGCFGALRKEKNFSTAIVAALELAHSLRAPTEIWINSGRDDGNGNVVLNAARAWTHNVPNVTLKQLHWASWPEFRRTAGSMNVCLQPSFTESFNNVTADACAEGVASVVSDVIDWVPSNWIASTDNSTAIASAARRLLFDGHAVREGYAALQKYVTDGLVHWKAFFGRP